MDKVVHFEVPADNLARAKKFYSTVFGWKIENAPMPEGEYAMVYTSEIGKDNMPVDKGVINGGMMTRSPMKEGPMIVINVDSIDRSLEKIKKAGGTVVMEKTNVMDMGLYARAKDTEGNFIGVWENLMR